MRKIPKSISFTALVAVIAFAVIVSAPLAEAQTSRDVLNRINRLENEIDTLNRAVYRGDMAPPAAMQGGVPLDASSGAAVEVRLQGLEQQIRNLTGEIERQAFEVRQLQESFDRYKTDSTMRLNDLEGAPTASPAAQTRGMQYIPPQNNAARPPTPLTVGETVQPSVETASQNLGAVSPNGDTLDDAASRYETAFALIRNAQYDQAETAFQGFLTNHPDHPLAGNAEYWLAETHYVRGNFERAARMFATAYQKYPQGQKAPDNLLKLGLSLSAMGNGEDACTALRQLQSEFGAQPGPVTRRGEQEMTRLGC